MLHNNELKVKKLPSQKYISLLRFEGLELCSPTKHHLNLSYLVINVAVVTRKSKTMTLNLAHLLAWLWNRSHKWRTKVRSPQGETDKQSTFTTPSGACSTTCWAVSHTYGGVVKVLTLSFKTLYSYLILPTSVQFYWTHILCCNQNGQLTGL